MNCSDIKKLHQAFLDGELDSARQADIESHLNDCAECREGVSGAREFLDNVKQATERSSSGASADFRSRMQTNLDDWSKESSPQLQPIPAKSNPLRLVGSFIATAASVAIILVLLNSGSPKGSYLEAAVQVHESSLKGELEVRVKGPDAKALDQLVNQTMQVPVPVPLHEVMCPCGAPLDMTKAGPVGQTAFVRLNPSQSPYAVYLEYYCHCNLNVTLLVQYWPEAKPHNDASRTIDGKQYWVKTHNNRSVVCWRSSNGILYSVVAGIKEKKLITIAKKARTIVEKSDGKN